LWPFEWPLEKTLAKPQLVSSANLVGTEKDYVLVHHNEASRNNVRVTCFLEVAQPNGRLSVTYKRSYITLSDAGFF